MKTEKSRCATCAAFDAGECYLQPPFADGTRPKVTPDSWCLRFAERLNEHGWAPSLPDRCEVIGCVAVEPQTVVKVAELMRCDNAAAKLALFRLCDLGYVEREKWKYSATDEGLKLAGIFLDDKITAETPPERFSTMPPAMFQIISNSGPILTARETWLDGTAPERRIDLFGVSYGMHAYNAAAKILAARGFLEWSDAALGYVLATPKELKQFKRNYGEQEFVSQFPFGEKAAKPLGVIRKQACSNLGISEERFSYERFNQLTAGTINKITLPSGEERYYR